MLNNARRLFKAGCSKKRSNHRFGHGRDHPNIPLGWLISIEIEINKAPITVLITVHDLVPSLNGIDRQFATTHKLIMMKPKTLKEYSHQK